MNIVLWSPVPGKCSTSASTVAIATYMSLTTDAKCSIVPLNCCNLGAQSAFITKDGNEQLSRTVGGFGIDALVMSIDGGFTTGADLSDAALQIHPKLDYYKATSSPRVATIESRIANVTPQIFDILGKDYEYSFIDAGAGFNEVTAAALNRADVLIVCINQSIDTIDKLFELCNLQNVPCLFLVTNYDKAMQLTVRNLSVRYKLLNPLNTFTLPHCVKFANSLNNSDTIKFFTINSLNSKWKNDVETKEFFDALKRLSTRLQKERK